MNTFFTADTHFLDTSIERYSSRGDAYREAGFLDHDSWLVSVWNAQVSAGDLVYVVGDFSFASSAQELGHILDRLNGSIHLVKGNHDRTNALNEYRHPKMLRWSYRQSVCINSVQTVLTHEPKIVWVGQHLGSFHLHGHTHGRLALPGRLLDVGMDNAFNLFGAHRLFSENDVHQLLMAKSVVSYDGRRLRVGHDAVRNQLELIRLSGLEADSDAAPEPGQTNHGH